MSPSADLGPAAILRRCEHIIKYCLAHEGMQHVEQSLGALRFIRVSFDCRLPLNLTCADESRQGVAARVAKKSCRDAGAQAEQTIWLYEDWWKAPSLRSSKGLKLQKGHGAGIVDALMDAFMQTQEGVLFHEVSFPCHNCQLAADRVLSGGSFGKQRTDAAIAVSGISSEETPIGTLERWGLDWRFHVPSICEWKNFRSSGPGHSVDAQANSC
jgi:hypothetical protein